MIPVLCCAVLSCAVRCHAVLRCAVLEQGSATLGRVVMQLVTSPCAFPLNV